MSGPTTTVCGWEKWKKGCGVIPSVAGDPVVRRIGPGGRIDCFLIDYLTGSASAARSCLRAGTYRPNVADPTSLGDQELQASGRVPGVPSRFGRSLAALDDARALHSGHATVARTFATGSSSRASSSAVKLAESRLWT